MKYIGDDGLGYFLDIKGIPSRAPGEAEFEIQPFHITRLMEIIWRLERQVEALQRDNDELDKANEALRSEIRTQTAEAGFPGGDYKGAVDPRRTFD